MYVVVERERNVDAQSICTSVIIYRCHEISKVRSELIEVPRDSIQFHWELSPSFLQNAYDHGQRNYFIGRGHFEQLCRHAPAETLFSNVKLTFVVDLCKEFSLYDSKV